MVALSPATIAALERLNTKPGLGYDLDAIRDGLRADMAKLAEDLTGEQPNRKLSSRRDLRFGRKGSVSVRIDKGVWHSFEDGEGGDALGMVLHYRKCGFIQAVQWAADWLGIATADGPPSPMSETDQAERARQRAEKQSILEAERQHEVDQKATHARAYWERSTPIAGTLAEQYLTGARGIPAPPKGWPDSVRFYDGTKALIVAGTDADGTVQRIQMIRLTDDAGKIVASERRPVKETRGAGAAPVRLPGPPDGPLLIAEGPETAITLWAVTGFETWAILGVVSRAERPADFPENRRVVLCPDDDARGNSDKTARVARRTWPGSVVAYPWDTRREDKSDFNDVLRAQGADMVRARIAAVLSPKRAATERVLIAEARGQLFRVILEFVEAAAQYHAGRMAEPPAHALRIDVGAGKSTLAQGLLVPIVVHLREKGSKATLVFLVPRLELADEMAARIRRESSAELQRGELSTLKRDPVVLVWRGRDRDDPDAPGKQMCRKLDMVKVAEDALDTPNSAACKLENTDGSVFVCELFHECGYQRQARIRADIVIAAHQLLFTERPPAFGDVAFCVVDESMWQKGLIGIEKKIEVTLDSLDEYEVIDGDAGATQRLYQLRQSALSAIRGLPDGAIPRSAFENMRVPLVAAEAREAWGLEWRFRLPSNLVPGMSIRRAREVAGPAVLVNGTVKRRAMFWEVIGELLNGTAERSGRAALGWDRKSKNGPVRTIVLTGLRPIHKSWTVPTLVMDATMDIGLVRAYWPNCTLTADIKIAAPHQTVVQVDDQTYSLRKLSQNTASEAEKLTRMNNLRKVHAIIMRYSREYADREILVVLQKDIEDTLKANFALPSNVRTAHHNGLSGSDEYSRVRQLIIVGRT